MAEKETNVPRFESYEVKRMTEAEKLVAEIRYLDYSIRQKEREIKEAKELQLKKLAQLAIQVIIDQENSND